MSVFLPLLVVDRAAACAGATGTADEWRDDQLPRMPDLACPCLPNSWQFIQRLQFIQAFGDIL